MFYHVISLVLGLACLLHVTYAKNVMVATDHRTGKRTDTAITENVDGLSSVQIRNHVSAIEKQNGLQAATPASERQIVDNFNVTLTPPNTQTTAFPFRPELYQCLLNVTGDPLYLKTSNQTERNEIFFGAPFIFWRFESAKELPMYMMKVYFERFQSNSYPISEKNYAIGSMKMGLFEYIVCPPLPRPTFTRLDFLPNFKPIDREPSIFVVFVYLDARSPPVSDVRVYAVAPFKSAPYFCQVACAEYPNVAFSVPSDVTYISVMPKVDRVGIWQQHIYNCQLRFNCTPTHVTLTTGECAKPVNVFPIKTVEQNTTTPPITFGVCVSTIFDMNDDDIPRLLEFVETYRYFGAEKIFLYDTYNTSERFEAVVRHYEKAGFIERIPWRIPTQVRTLFYFGQVLQYNDCVYRHMDRVQYLGLFDLDDIFVPSGRRTYQRLFSDISDWGGTILDYAAFHFRWIPLCSSRLSRTRRRESQTEGKTVLTLNTASHTIAGETPLEWKQVIVPRGAVYVHIHDIKSCVTGRLLKWVQQEPEHGIVYHYRENNILCRKIFPSNTIYICPHLSTIHQRVVKKLIAFDLIEMPVHIENATRIKTWKLKRKTDGPKRSVGGVTMARRLTTEGPKSRTSLGKDRIFMFIRDPKPVDVDLALSSPSNGRYLPLLQTTLFLGISTTVVCFALCKRRRRNFFRVMRSTVTR